MRTFSHISVALCMVGGSSFAQSLYSVAIDTSRVHGTPGTLVFDITSNRPLTNRVDLLSFSTDGKTGLAETQGVLVSGDIVENTAVASRTRIKAYGFFTELTIPFQSFGDQISFGINASEMNPHDGTPPDLVSISLFDADGHSLTSLEDSSAPILTLTITGDRGGELDLYKPGRGSRSQTDDSGILRRPVPNESLRRLPGVTVAVRPAWQPDDPALFTNAVALEGGLTEFCSRRCDGLTICTGGAFGIAVGDDFYAFDDLGNLKTQVALVSAGENPLGEGRMGGARVVGVVDKSKSTITVRDVSVFH